jgi:hypothetical protein
MDTVHAFIQRLKIWETEAFVLTEKLRRVPPISKRLLESPVETHRRPAMKGTP